MSPAAEVAVGLLVAVLGYAIEPRRHNADVRLALLEHRLSEIESRVGDIERDLY